MRGLNSTGLATGFAMALGVVQLPAQELPQGPRPAEISTEVRPEFARTVGDWRPAAITAEASSFVDTGTIRISGGHAQAWVANIFSIPHWNAEKSAWIQVIVSLEDIDCASKDLKFTNVSIYTIDLSRVDQPVDFAVKNKPGQNPTGDLIYGALCGAELNRTLPPFKDVRTAIRSYLTMRQQQMRLETMGEIAR